MRFDACAADYDSHSLPQKMFAERVALFCRPSKAERVLELGAGTGGLTAQLLRHGAKRVTATDSSPRMVQIGESQVPLASWQILDAFEGIIPGADLQISSGLLQWTERPVEVLKHWKRGVTATGRLVHGFPCHPCLTEWRNLFDESPVIWRTQSEWLEIFQLAELQVLRHDLWVERHLFNSALQIARGMHRSGVTGRVRVGPGTLRKALRVYDARHRTEQGVQATWAWMAVEAVPCLG